MSANTFRSNKQPLMLKPVRSWFFRLNWIGVAGLLVLLGLWEVAKTTGVMTFKFIPAPTEIFDAIGGMIREGALQSAVLHTASVALQGWMIAIVVGVIVGTALGLSRTAWSWTAASIEVLRSFPSITFVPVAVLIFGFSSTMELVVVIYAATWLILLNTLEGVREVKPGLIETAQTFQMSRVRKIRTVVFPAAAPKIIVGMKLGLNLALILAVAAEVVGNPAGLGYGLTVEQNALQPARMFVYFISVGVLGIVLNAILQLIVKLVLPGITAASDRGRS